MSLGDISIESTAAALEKCDAVIWSLLCWFWRVVNDSDDGSWPMISYLLTIKESREQDICSVYMHKFKAHQLKDLTRLKYFITLLNMLLGWTSLSNTSMDKDNRMIF